MQKKLSNRSKKATIKIGTFFGCSLIFYYFLGSLFSQVFLLSPFFIIFMIVCGMLFRLPNKYLIPTAYLLLIINDIIIQYRLGTRMTGFESAVVLSNTYITIFASFFIISIYIIKKEKGEIKDVRREMIIKKILWLIFVVIAIVIFYILVIFKYYE